MTKDSMKIRKSMCNDREKLESFLISSNTIKFAEFIYKLDCFIDSLYELEFNEEKSDPSLEPDIYNYIKNMFSEMEQFFD